MSMVLSPMSLPQMPAGGWVENVTNAADGGSVLSDISRGEFSKILGSLEDGVITGPPRFPREENVAEYLLKHPEHQRDSAERQESVTESQDELDERVKDGSSTRFETKRKPRPPTSSRAEDSWEVTELAGMLILKQPFTSESPRVTTPEDAVSEQQTDETSDGEEHTVSTMSPAAEMVSSSEETIGELPGDEWLRAEGKGTGLFSEGLSIVGRDGDVEAVVASIVQGSSTTGYEVPGSIADQAGALGLPSRAVSEVPMGQSKLYDAEPVLRLMGVTAGRTAAAEEKQSKMVVLRDSEESPPPTTVSEKSESDGISSDPSIASPSEEAEGGEEEPSPDLPFSADGKRADVPTQAAEVGGRIEGENRQGVSGVSGPSASTARTRTASRVSMNGGASWMIAGGLQLKEKADGGAAVSEDILRFTSFDSTTSGAFGGWGSYHPSGEFRGSTEQVPQIDRSRITRAVERLEQAIPSMVDPKEATTLSLRLDPPSLGSVSVEVTIRDGELHARLAPESPHVAVIMRERSHELQAALRKMGLSLDEVRVSIETSSHSFQSDGFTASSEGHRQGFSGHRSSQVWDIDPTPSRELFGEGVKRASSYARWIA